jgi:hypothetical protein
VGCENTTAMGCNARKTNKQTIPYKKLVNIIIIIIIIKIKAARP